MEEATSENVLMGTAMARRAMYMYGSRLPASATGLVDNGLGKAVPFGRVGILPPTLLVQQPREEHVIDGVRFVFHNVPGSEAPSEFTFSLPELQAFCGAELMGHTLHNLYTLRGAKVRDALRWSGYLNEALKQVQGSEVVFTQHHWPVWGAERIRGGGFWRPTVEVTIEATSQRGFEWRGLGIGGGAMDVAHRPGWVAAQWQHQLRFIHRDTDREVRHRQSHRGDADGHRRAVLKVQRRISAPAARRGRSRGPAPRWCARR